MRSATAPIFCEHRYEGLNIKGDGGTVQRMRMYGMIATTFVNVALIIWAIVRLVELALGR